MFSLWGSRVQNLGTWRAFRAHPCLICAHSSVVAGLLSAIKGNDEPVCVHHVGSRALWIGWRGDDFRASFLGESILRWIYV